MRTDKRKTGSFLQMLIKNYVGFTFTVLILVIAISTLINKQIERRLYHPNYEAFQKYEYLLDEGKYREFPYHKVLGSRSSFVILDRQQNPLYVSSRNMQDAFTEKELYCIPDIDSFSETEMTVYTSEEGEKQILLKKYESLPGGQKDEYYEMESFMVLDDQYRVVTNMMDFPWESISRREVEYMTETVPGPFNYMKHYFKGKNGLPYTAVFRYEKTDEVTYEKVFSSTEKLWLLMIPFYALAVILFALKLNHKVKKPLASLGQAITGYREGELPAGDYRGPNEFVEIGDDFARLTKKLNESEERRLKADRDKQKMLADISHDLKTPITVIQGYSKAICDGVVPAESREQYLQTIYSKATALTELINTFYEYSKLDHPDFRPALEKRDVCEYAREYLAYKYNEIAVAGFELEADIPDEPLYCDIDVLQYRRVFENIIANSVRHNPKGTILYFSMREEGNSIRISIGDNGRGIPKDIRDSIFEPFVVGDESRNSKEGTGLGMAIARKIVESHKGFLELSKRPSKGLSTEFIIWMRKSGAS